MSLTSFPPRFGILHLTLESLLNQSVRPDKIVLWIAEKHLPLLPHRVRRLESRGISIRGCQDIGSYKKLIYAITDFPDAFIATADDDLFYEPAWLEGLVGAIEPGGKTIVCHRAHRIKLDESGAIAPYADWGKKALDVAPRTPSKDLLPTTGAGVLYPPGSLSAGVLQMQLFERLCPTGDDLWFYWMARKAGTKIMKSGSPFRLIEWPSQDSPSLWEENRAGGNDRQIKNLEEAFGNPLTFPDP